jgi:hypothetical protein
MEIKGKVAVVPAPGPALIPLSAVTDAVVGFVEDDSSAGRVVLLDREKPPQLLGPNHVGEPR